MRFRIMPPMMSMAGFQEQAKRSRKDLLQAVLYRATIVGMWSALRKKEWPILDMCGLPLITHRISNAVAEELNSKIATVKNVPVDAEIGTIIKIAIDFQCGGLDLSPASVAHRKVG